MTSSPENPTEIGTDDAYPGPERRPIAWVTWTLVISTVVVFLAQLTVLHFTGQDRVGDALAFSGDSLHEGRYWTLLTYAWAHAVAIFGQPDLFWLHIVANMIPLVCLGPALEDFIGHLRFLGLYLGAAIFAALVTYALTPAVDHDQTMIGASGAVFGLIAGAGTAAPRARVMVYVLFVLPLRMSLRVLALGICGLELAQAVFHWMPEVAHSAHLGGAAFGFVYVLLLRLFSGWWSFPR